MGDHGRRYKLQGHGLDDACTVSDVVARALPKIVRVVPKGKTKVVFCGDHDLSIC